MSDDARTGKRKYNYEKCGNKPGKVNKDLEDYLVKTLKELRAVSIATSAVLQHRLAKDKGVKLSARYIRKLVHGQDFKDALNSCLTKFGKDDMPRDQVQHVPLEEVYKVMGHRPTILSELAGGAPCVMDSIVACTGWEGSFL